MSVQGRPTSEPPHVGVEQSPDAARRSAQGTPAGRRVAWKTTDGPEIFDAVEAGYVIAPADVALWLPQDCDALRLAGRIEAIAIAADAEAPMGARRARERAGRT
jgi:hypothetical protein